MSSSVDFWYFLISRRATVPGLYLLGFLTRPRVGHLPGFPLPVIVLGFDFVLVMLVIPISTLYQLLDFKKMNCDPN